MSPLDAVDDLLRLLESAGERLRADLTGCVADKHGAGLVSELDHKLERDLRRELPALWPESVVVGEESGGKPGDWTWWLDPLDGTTNRVHGWPRAAISAALYHGSEAVLGAVRDPYLRESFWAVRGQGAWHAGQRLRTSDCTDLSRALLCTGFAPAPLAQWEVCRNLQCQSRGIRVSGCASLDLAYVAAGRVDGFWEVDLKAWDVAAGLLLVAEAGGWASDLAGRPPHLDTGDYLACAPGLAPLLLEQMASL